MNLLIDTHVLLWALGQPQKLPPHITAMLLNEQNALFVSAISIAEIAIKRSTARGDLPPLPAERIASALTEAGYLLLDLSSSHAAQLEFLPFHHRDPFDRLLIAQALTEGMRLVTHDRQLTAYGDFVLTF